MIAINQLEFNSFNFNSKEGFEGFCVDVNSTDFDLVLCKETPTAVRKYCFFFHISWSPYEWVLFAIIDCDTFIIITRISHSL